MELTPGKCRHCGRKTEILPYICNQCDKIATDLFLFGCGDEADDEEPYEDMKGGSYDSEVG